MWPTGTSSQNESPKMTTSQSVVKFTEDESTCELALLVELTQESNVEPYSHSGKKLFSRKKSNKQVPSFLHLEVPLTDMLSCHKVMLIVSVSVLSKVFLH